MNLKKVLILILVALTARTLWALDPVPPSPDKGSWGPRPMRGINCYGRFTPENMKDLRAWGINHIRYQIVKFGPGLVQANGEWTFDDRTWEGITDILGLAGGEGIRVVLDVHGNPFFPGEIWNRETIASWQNPENRRKLASLWRSIAARFKDDRTVVAAYEIMNEPAPPRTDEGYRALNEIMKEVTAAIRAVDVWHTIIVGGPEYSRPPHMMRIEPTGDPNTVYTCHMYEPTEFTHQGISWMKAPFGQVYPGTMPLGWDKKEPAQVDRDFLVARMMPAVQFQKKYNARIYVGEFSARRDCPDNSAYRWLKDVVTFFEEQRWDWAYHAYRGDRYGDPTFSLEHSSETNDRVRHATTDRLELLKSFYARNALPAPHGGK